MKCWTNAIVCQLEAVRDIVREDYWTTEDLETISDALNEAAGNLESVIALRRKRRGVMKKYGYPDQGGAA